MFVLFAVTAVLLLLSVAVTRYDSDAEKEYDVKKYLFFILAGK
jgi:hypothetical protein